MAFVKYWRSAVSLLGSLISLYVGLSGKSPVPQWMWIIVAYVALAYAGFALWWGERRTAKTGSAFRTALMAVHRDVLVKWAALNDLYQNSHKPKGAPKTLPDPMSRGQWAIGDLEFRFRVGELQSETNTVLQGLRILQIDITYPTNEIRSVSELVTILERAKF